MAAPLFSNSGQSAQRPGYRDPSIMGAVTIGITLLVPPSNERVWPMASATLSGRLAIGR